jgi:hypothetical protein
MNSKKIILEGIFSDFLGQYLKNVARELPQSYRARQLEAGGYGAELVFEFEARFLKEPFKKALESFEKKIKEEVINKPITLTNLAELAREKGEKLSIDIRSKTISIMVIEKCLRSKTFAQGKNESLEEFCLRVARLGLTI